jgi:dihydrofolate synthase/folylpolyglutamate synthase
LAQYVTAVRTVIVPGDHKTLPAEAVAESAQQAGIKAKPAADVGAALTDIVASSKTPVRVLICGSLYLAGSVLADNG